ncbi:methyl-accepting chemotaxis protein [Desulfocurvus sp. DL9XJH121]
MTVKSKLALIGATALGALAVIFVVSFVGGKYESEAKQVERAALGAKMSLLEALRLANDFQAAPDDKLAEQFGQSMKALDEQADRVASLAPEYAELTSDIKARGAVCSEKFKGAVDSTKIMGYTNKLGLQGRLTKAIGGLENQVRAVGVGMGDILTTLAELRRMEKDFFLSHKEADVAAFDITAQTLRALIESNTLLTINEKVEGMVNLADEYVSAFKSYVERDGTLRTNRQALRTSINELLPLMDQLQQNAEAASAQLNTRTKQVSMIVEGVTAVALLLMVLTVIRSIVGPLSRLQAYAQQVACGDFSEISADGFSGELRSLHGDITAMVGEIKAKLGYSQAVLESIPIPCATVDPSDHLTFVNQQMMDFLARDGAPDDYLGWSMSRFSYDEEDAQTTSGKVLSSDETLDMVSSLTSLDGQQRHMRVAATPIHGLSGEIQGAITLCVDQTEQHRQQEFIQNKNATIAQAATDANGISEQVASALQELAAQVDQSSTGAELQRTRTSEVATALEEMNATVLEVARNASSSAELALEARNKAQEGQDIVKGMVRTNEELSGMAEELSRDMAELGRQAEGIGTIMNVISDIADQTNLLALNAAIEAARAGDAGRGFAVVADEVRKLAEKTMQATSEVGDYIQNIQHSADRNIKATEKTTEAIERSSTMSASAGKALEEIVGFVERTSDQVREIATAAEEQSAASEQISHSAEEINGTALEIAQAMNESAQAVNGLAELSGNLNDVISGMQD